MYARHTQRVDKSPANASSRHNNWIEHKIKIARKHVNYWIRTHWTSAEPYRKQSSRSMAATKLDATEMSNLSLLTRRRKKKYG